MVPYIKSLVAERGGEGVLVGFLMEELYSFTEEGWEQETTSPSSRYDASHSFS